MLFGQASGDIPAWADIASTGGLGAALLWFVYKLGQGELVSRDTYQQEQQMTEALASVTATNAHLAEVLREATVREDRLLKYLEENKK